MLKVGIHDDHAIARHIVETCKHGILLAEVAGEVYVVDARILRPEFFHHVQRGIGTAVVDQEHFPLVAGSQRCIVHQLA